MVECNFTMIQGWGGMGSTYLYIDILFVDNLAMNFIILRIVYKALQEQKRCLETLAGCCNRGFLCCTHCFA